MARTDSNTPNGEKLIWYLTDDLASYGWVATHVSDETFVLSRRPDDPRSTGGTITCSSVADLALFLYEEKLIIRGVIR